MVKPKKKITKKDVDYKLYEETIKGLKHLKKDNLQYFRERYMKRLNLTTLDFFIQK